ncbi:MAG: ACP S-malonyltransferase [Pseudomonadota bacterium]
MKNLAILFPGQGSQYIGMGKALFEQEQEVHTLFNTAAMILDIDVERLCFAGTAEELNSTENTQPLILLCSVAAWQSFQRRTGIIPAYFAGHSLGELSALTCAGALSIEDGLRLARARGLAMANAAQASETGMAAVTRISRAQLEQICQAQSGFGRELVIANFNSSTQHVISGSLAQLQMLEEPLRAADADFIKLRVSGAFHSPYMETAAQEFAELVNKVKWTAPTIPVISNVTAKPHQLESICKNLVRQITHPVMWQDNLQFLADEGCDVFIELGPKSVLKKLALNNLNDASAFAFDLPEDLEPAMKVLAPAIKALRERPSLSGKCLAVAVATRNTNWDNDSYQQGVIEPYQQLKRIHEEYSQQGVPLSKTLVGKIIALLRGIMICKGASSDEQLQRIAQIAEQTGYQQQDLLFHYSNTEIFS